MIVLIDNYDSFTYNLYQTLAIYNTEIQVLRNDQISVEEVRALNPSGIVISPGPGRPEEAGICIELIHTLSLQIPTLGVCLGLQAIVLAFGGKIVNAPEVVHGKQSPIFHHRGALYQDLPLPFQAGRYHSLMVETESFPSVLTIEAETSQGMIMGVSHKFAPIYGVQFHPESILTPMGSLLLKNFINQCKSSGV